MSIMRPFTEHPASVGETYGQHMRSALSFAVPLLGASLACFVHALLPFLFTQTGSRAITRLHERMVVSRQRAKHVGGGQCDQSALPVERQSATGAQAGQTA